MRTLFRSCRPALGLVVALAPAVALAHPGHEGDHGVVWDFTAGFGHPFSGWDHLLAMIAVGLWAAQLGGRARWLVPTAFLVAMSLAAAAGRLGVTFPSTEQAIAASVFLLGLLLAGTVRLPVLAGMALVAAFAVFHGLAHGAELPSAANGFTYGVGFVLATALLHGAGLGSGAVAHSRIRARGLQVAGWLIAASGVALLAF